MKTFEDALVVGGNLWYLNDSGVAKKLRIKKIVERQYIYPEQGPSNLYEVGFDKAVNCYDRFILLDAEKLGESKFVNYSFGFAVYTEPGLVLKYLEKREAQLVDKCIRKAELAEQQGNTEAVEYWTDRMLKTEERYSKLYEEIR